MFFGKEIFEGSVDCFAKQACRLGRESFLFMGCFVYPQIEILKTNAVGLLWWKLAW